MNQKKIITLLFAGVIFTCVAILAFAQPPPPPEGCFHHDAGGMCGLTDEQHQELRAEIDALQAAGATREEIDEAIAAKYSAWGLEAPEFRGPPEEPFMASLTEEQRRALHSMKEELRSSGVPREEAEETIRVKLAEYGVEVPDDFRCGPPRGRHCGLMDQLNEEQQAELHALREQLRAQGATREEMHAAEQAKLAEYGIEMPDRPPRHGGPPPFMEDLTDTQKEVLESKLQELRDAGVSREEMHAEIRVMLESFGIEFPGEGREAAGGENGSNLDIPTENTLVLAGENYPNPFNPETTISFSLQEAEHVTVCIYDAQGNLVRTIMDHHQPAGYNTVLWDGHNETGQLSASGIYFYQITAGQESLTRQMILIK